MVSFLKRTCAIFIFVFYCFPVAHALASTLVESVPLSGADASTGTLSAFSATDISKLSASDDTRIQSNGGWPNTDAYDENKYIEFVLSPNIPNDAVMESVSLTHEFRRSGALTAAKLEVWDGVVWHEYPLSLGSINIDHTDTIDAISFLDTSMKINDVKIRFLAFRSGTATTTTSHDFIKLSVTYSIPESTPPPPAPPDDPPANPPPDNIPPPPDAPPEDIPQEPDETTFSESIPSVPPPHHSGSSVPHFKSKLSMATPSTVPYAFSYPEVVLSNDAELEVASSVRTESLAPHSIPLRAPISLKNEPMETVHAPIVTVPPAAAPSRTKEHAMISVGAGLLASVCVFALIPFGL